MKIGTLILTLMFLSGFSMESMSQSLQYGEPEEVGLSSMRLGRIDTLMDSYVADRKISGAVTLVARHGEIAHFEAHGFRDVESQSPMRRDTVFRIASMTKIFTSLIRAWRRTGTPHL